MGCVGGGVGKCVGREGKVCGDSVWGEWGSVLVCGKRNGGGVGKCARV